MKAYHDSSRNIDERIHISGTLILQSPAHFGNGEVQGNTLVDMTLLMDDAEDEPRALIPGTTIAGALRSYLGERLYGYAEQEPDSKNNPVGWLFGPQRRSKENLDQSLLIVEDALASTHKTVLRDGVRIDEKSRTAYIETTETGEAGAKFDVELLEAGTKFDLNFELLLTEKKGAKQMLPYLVAALQGLEKGEIRLGLRKRRGYGRCQVKEWTVSHYQLSDPTDLCLWLGTSTTAHREGAVTDSLAQAFAQTPKLTTSANIAERMPADQRHQFILEATFGLENSSVLIRSGFGKADIGPDMEHLHALNEHDELVPVIPGTSWAGVVRHRAMRIAKTISRSHIKDEESSDEQAYKQAILRADKRATQMVDQLFGHMITAEEAQKAQRERSKVITGEASRTTFDETYIENGQNLYQTRVQIDRFTGGAYDSALFEQVPVYGKKETEIGFHLHLRDPKPHEIGLMMLVLKDLWTGDLPVGGEASVGRGRLAGQKATLCIPSDCRVENLTVDSRLEMDQTKPSFGLEPSQQEFLEGCVQCLGHYLAHNLMDEDQKEQTHD